MALDLNADGHLPKRIRSCTFESVFDLFVSGFPSSQTRHALFQEWKAYNQRLKQFIPKVELVQWVNGSYVTNKVNPNDIDCVTCIPFVHYQQLEDELIEFYTTVSLHDRDLDAYICPVYPVENEVSYNEYHRRQADWSYLFGQVKGSTAQKGFLEITF